MGLMPMKIPLIRIASVATLMGISLAVVAADDVVARMGKSELRVADFSHLVEEANPEQARKFDAPTLERAARSEIIRRAIIEQAKNQGWDQAPQVRERMARAADQALLTSYLEDIVRPPANFPSETELRSAYEATKNQLKTTKQYRVAQIYVSSENDTVDKESERKINQIWRDASKRGKDFANLARQYSEHKASADNGGDMGWVPESGMLPEIRDTVASLKRLDISRPIKSAQGYHILKLIDVKEPTNLTFEEAKPILTQELRAQRSRDIEASFLKTLEEKNPISISQDGLREVMSGNP
jgi:parvulin-like peptidyl-prolyl isomerase